MHWAWQWSAVLLVLAIADVAVRLVTGFNLLWVIRAEAALFLTASVVLVRLYRRRPAPARWQRGLQTVVVTGLALGGLRALLWAVGLSVQGANLLVLATAVLGGAAAWWRRHRARAAA